LPQRGSGQAQGSDRSYKGCAGRGISRHEFPGTRHAEHLKRLDQKRDHAPWLVGQQVQLEASHISVPADDFPDSAQPRVTVVKRLLDRLLGLIAERVRDRRDAVSASAKS
jgi:hypothetical protein